MKFAAFSRTEAIAASRGYRVAKDGSVFFRNHRQRALLSDRWGYLFFRIKVHPVKKRVAVHRLHAFQKFGQRIYGVGLVVRHYDGNTSNNAASNIHIGTQKQNVADTLRHGRRLGKARKLSPIQLEEVALSRLSYAELAKQFHVSEATICLARTKYYPQQKRKAA